MKRILLGIFIAYNTPLLAFNLLDWFFQKEGSPQNKKQYSCDNIFELHGLERKLCETKQRVVELEKAECKVGQQASNLDAKELKEREERVKSAVAMLNSKFPIIRVGLGDTWGYGHQSAGIEVVRSLLRLGYNGTVQIVSSELPGSERFNNLSMDFRHLHNVIKITPGEARKTMLSLGFVGGNDKEFNIKSLNTRITFSFQPLQWVRSRMICAENQEEPSRCYEPQALKDQNQSFHYETIAGSDFTQLANEYLEHVSARNNSIAVVQAIEKHDINLMVGYFNVVGKLSLCQIVSGLRFFQDHHDHKGIVLLAYRADEFACKISSRDHIFSGKLRGDAPISLPKENEILVLRSPPVPQVIFRELVRRSNLPVVLEGANTTNFLRLLQRPYISTNLRFTGIPLIKNCENIKDAIESISKALEDLGYIEGSQPEFNDDSIQVMGELVGKFIIAAMNHHSAISEYFLELGRINLLPENDMVATGLIELEKYLSNPPESHNIRKEDL